MPATPDRRRQGALAWALRVALALVFLYEGLDKFRVSRLWTTVFDGIGIGGWFRYATGAIEIAGGLLLLVPRATAVAVPVLASTMVGALLTHAFVIGLGPHTVVVTVLLGLLIVVGWRSGFAVKPTKYGRA